MERQVTLSYTEYQEIAANIRPNGQAFIDGKFCDAADGQKFDTTNPATGQVLASVANCIDVIAIYIKISIKIRSFRVLVTPAGLEPATPRFEVRCSIQLS